MDILFGIGLAAAVGFDVLLYAGVSAGYLGTIVMSDAVFGLDLFEDVLYLRWQVGDRLNPVFENCRSVFRHRDMPKYLSQIRYASLV